MWTSVEISMRKNPAAFDQHLLENIALNSDGIATLFHGPVSDIYEKYPRNVNAMVACALATIGIDRCQSKLIVDNSINYGEIAVTAEGRDNSRLHVVKQQPMTGVSGTEMASSVYYSALKALGLFEPLDFV